MCEHSEQAFAGLSLFAAGAKGGTEQAFIARDGALDLPALTIAFAVGRVFHLPAILRLGPLAAGAAFIESD